MNGSSGKGIPAKLPNKTQPNYRMKFGQTTEWSKIFHIFANVTQYVYD